MKTDVKLSSLTGLAFCQRVVRFRCPKPGASPPPAFTRLDLLTALAGLALLAGVALPGLANPRARSERVVCVNNLRQIGQTFQTWAADHGDRNPWWVPQSLGGTQLHPLSGNAWLHFACISNQLGSPKVLACPADLLAKPARDWSVSPPWGFLSPAMRNNSVSYFVGLHAFSDYPQSWLAGDRNLRCQGRTDTCSTGAKGAAFLNPPWQAAWTNDLHGEAGNLLLSSGEVRQLAPPGLPASLEAAAPPFSQIHLLFPR